MADVDTIRIGDVGTPVNRPAAAGALLEAGHMGAVDAAGNAVAVTAAAGLKILGRIDKRVDNTGGAAGDKRVEILQGEFIWQSVSGGGAVTAANIGDTVYADSSTTVTTTSTARSEAGTVVDVSADGVRVRMEA